MSSTESPKKRTSSTLSEEEPKRLRTESGSMKPTQEQLDADPYLMKEVDYIKKEKRWLNKQRTLVFSSRGVGSQSRHMMQDIKRLLPHHKEEPKFEKKTALSEIAEICELKSCNNCVYFESRKHKHSYMYLGRIPDGPTVKFQMFNMHTLGETKLLGNCLHGSRPLLHFDTPFDKEPHLKLIKELFMQMWGTPRNHPRSKPFFDHVLSFFWVDNKIFFRHYQIQPETPDVKSDPDRQMLSEIGPRFVLSPVLIMDKAFEGEIIWKNPEYKSPSLLSREQKIIEQAMAKEKIARTDNTKARRREANGEADEIDEIFG